MVGQITHGAWKVMRVAQPLRLPLEIGIVNGSIIFGAVFIHVDAASLPKGMAVGIQSAHDQLLSSDLRQQRGSQHSGKELASAWRISRQAASVGETEGPRDPRAPSLSVCALLPYGMCAFLSLSMSASRWDLGCEGQHD